MSKNKDYGNGRGQEFDENNALSTIEIEHYKIHEGNHFFLRNYDTIQLSDTIEFVVDVLEKVPHVKFDATGTDGLTVKLYEGTSGVTGGTEVSGENNNRNSTTDSDITITKDPTAITDNGTLIWQTSVGTNNRAGTVDFSEEIILKANTSYYFVITSLGNSNAIGYHAKWYEVDVNL